MTDQASPLQAAIEVIEQLSLEDQAQLLHIMYRRLIEAHREQLTQEIAAARQAHQSGQVKRGSADDILRGLTE
jgi:RNA polymerase-interacting CarD/CdnL/TRCF family regulator